MRVLALSGSLRAASVNSALLRAAVRLAPAGIAVQVQAGLGALPLFNPDLEWQLPNTVAELRAAVADADALIIASPEYAHGITGVMNNPLDWLVALKDGATAEPAVSGGPPAPVGLYEASVPVFGRYLGRLRALVDIAESHTRAHRLDAAQLLGARLAPDMLPFETQAVIAANFSLRTRPRCESPEESKPWISESPAAGPSCVRPARAWARAARRRWCVRA